MRGQKVGPLLCHSNCWTGIGQSPPLRELRFWPVPVNASVGQEPRQCQYQQNSDDQHTEESYLSHKWEQDTKKASRVVTIQRFKEAEVYQGFVVYSSYSKDLIETGLT